MIRIDKPEECCGCSACYNVCPNHSIKMESNEKGFLYPQIDNSTCVNCGLCEKVCPLIMYKLHSFSSPETETFYALRLKDSEDLYHSSSGGAFYALARYVILNKGVVFGACYDSNMDVHHDFAITLEECKKFRGSKYSQSRIDDTFVVVKQYLKKGCLVLFSGTPCQNAGLLAFLGKDFNNLITVDLICHSVPSPTVYKEYNGFIESLYKDKISNIEMRDKTFGWSTSYSCRYYFKSGSQVHNPSELKCWQELFESGLLTRECCFHCAFTNLHRVTDFTIGDFWDFNKRRSDIYSKDGTSAVLINTKKARNILSNIRTDVLLWSVTREEIMQPRLKISTQMPVEYNLFWNLYKKKGFTYCYKKFFAPPSCNLLTRMVKKIMLK